MKILIVNTYYYPNIIGGAENSVKLLAENLPQIGDEVAVYCSDGKNEMRIENINGVKVYRGLGMKKFSPLYKDNRKGLVNKIQYKVNELSNSYSSNELLEVIDDFAPDLIHTNNLLSISTSVWKAVHDRKIKIVHTLRDYWLQCPMCTLTDRNDKICTSHKFPCKIYGNFQKSQTSYVDAVTAPSEFTLKYFISRGFFKNSKYAAVPNAINFNLDEVDNIIKKKKQRNQSVKFLFIGNLFASKGIKYLIENFTQIDKKNIELFICGDGPLKDFVINATKKDDRIKYMGRVAGEHKHNLFMECDVLIIPSIWYEPFGRVIIEAYKYGMPVIGTNLGGIPEIIVENKTGIIVDYTSNNKIQQAIISLSDRNNLLALMDNIADKLSEYSISDQVKRFGVLYKELINI